MDDKLEKFRIMARKEWDESKCNRVPAGSSKGGQFAPKGVKVIKVDLSADIQKQFDNVSLHQRQKIAFDYILKNLRGKHPTEDGRVVAIERLGASKITHTNNEIKIRATPELANLISNGRFINVVNIIHAHFKQMAYYEVFFEIDETTYVGTLNVGIRASGEATAYDLNPFNKKIAPPNKGS